MTISYQEQRTQEHKLRKELMQIPVASKEFKAKRLELKAVVNQIKQLLTY